jgi:hypothetical protein
MYAKNGLLLFPFPSASFFSNLLFDTDPEPDPAFHFDPDPVPAFKFGPDPAV